LNKGQHLRRHRRRMMYKRTSMHAENLTSIPGCGVRHGAEPENTGA